MPTHRRQFRHPHCGEAHTMTTAPTGVDPGVVTSSHPGRTAGNGAGVGFWTRIPA